VFSGQTAAVELQRQACPDDLDPPALPETDAAGKALKGNNLAPRDASPELTIVVLSRGQRPDSAM
jgi:hypothetical protein